MVKSVRHTVENNEAWVSVILSAYKGLIVFFIHMYNIHGFQVTRKVYIAQETSTQATHYL